MFKVCAERCDQCLFGKDRIVDEKRMRQVLASCRKNDSHFICHKHTKRMLDGQASESQADVCCRGFYDANPMATNLMRIAHRLKAIRFVNEDGSEAKKEVTTNG